MVTGPFFPPKRFMGYYLAKFSGLSVLCWHISYLIHSFSLLVYKKYGSTCLSSVVFWNALPVFWISDADAIKTVHSSRAVFSKDSQAVSHFSPSVGHANAEICFFFDGATVWISWNIRSELDQYRGCWLETAPVGCQFSFQRSVYKRFGLLISKRIDPVYQHNNALVWRETFRVVDEWFSEIDSAVKLNQTATVDLLKDVTQVNPVPVSPTIHLLLLPSKGHPPHNLICRFWMSCLLERRKQHRTTPRSQTYFPTCRILYSRAYDHKDPHPGLDSRPLQQDLCSLYLASSGRDPRKLWLPPDAHVGRCRIGTGLDRKW